MKILIVNNGTIPVHLYGGTERVIWGLGKELVKLGHEVSFLVKQGSYCHFAPVIHIDENKPIIEQIKNDYDVVHFNFRPQGIEKIGIPYIIAKSVQTDHPSPEQIDHPLMAPKIYQNVWQNFCNSFVV